jgi:UDP-N-acetylglucosamine 2-epimerase (non-hydrolysing)
MGDIAKKMHVIFPIHPRTRKAIEHFRLNFLLEISRIIILTPLNYLGFLGLMKDAKLVLTDSGGIQEETTALGIPCFTLRKNTERPITITEGTNTLVGTTREKIIKTFNEFLHKNAGKKNHNIPLNWDGHAAERISDIIVQWVYERKKIN